MIILIITIAILVIGIVLAIKEAHNWQSSLSEWGISLIIGASIFLIIELVLLCIKPINYKQFKIRYDTINEMTTSSDDIRDTNYTKELIEINTEINSNRTWQKSNWVGIFANKRIAELELLNK